MDTAQFATKSDVEEIVGRVVGELLNNALQLISERFDKVEARLDRVEARLNRVEERLDHVEEHLDRIEDKLDHNIATVAHHAIDIRKLRRKTA